MSKEVTRIVTIQLTGIIKLNNNEELISRDKAKEICIEGMKAIYDGDYDKLDITVQDFELDKE